MQQQGAGVGAGHRAAQGPPAGVGQRRAERQAASRALRRKGKGTDPAHRTTPEGGVRRRAAFGGALSHYEQCYFIVTSRVTCLMTSCLFLGVREDSVAVLRGASGLR